MATTEHHQEITEQDAPGTDLAHVEPVNPVRAGLVVRNMDDLASMATAVAASRMFKGTDSVEKAATKMMFAMAMGFDPMAGLTGIDIIEGNPTPNGHFWAAALESHPRYDYVVEESSAERCTITFLRDGQARGTLTWTMDDAQRAGLAGKDNWRKYPRPMLYNRCMTEGARMFCPQLFAGIRAYDPEEMEGISPAGSGPWRQTVQAPTPAEAPVRTITEYLADDGTRWFEVRFTGLPRPEHVDVTRAVRSITGAVADAKAKVWRVPASSAAVLVGPSESDTFAEAYDFDVIELAQDDTVIEHDDVIDPEPAPVEPSPTPQADPVPAAPPAEPETNLLGEPVATEEALAPAPTGDAPGDLPPLANIEEQYGTGDTDDAGAGVRWYALRALVTEQDSGNPDAFPEFADPLGIFTHAALMDGATWRTALAKLGYNVR